MSTTACLYAIVRFEPFVETGEFANVGILLMAPERGYFGFELLAKRYARVTHFFDLEPRVFQASMRILRQELERVAGLLGRHGFGHPPTTTDPTFARQMFEEVTRIREAIIRFGEPRAVLTQDPEAKLRELFEFYVDRNFVTHEYREQVLEKGVRKWLSDANLAARFAALRVGNDEYGAKFPFVEQQDGEPFKAIKPLYLGQDRSSAILDHAGQWVGRVVRLKRRRLLPPHVLFTVDGPAGDSMRAKAFRDAVDELRQTGVEVIPYRDRQEVLDFAAAGRGG